MRSGRSWRLSLPPQPAAGAPRKHDLRLVLNAILYILRGGDPWRLLPHEFPPWQSVSMPFEPSPEAPK
jgi:transposase